MLCVGLLYALAACAGASALCVLEPMATRSLPACAPSNHCAPAVENPSPTVQLSERTMTLPMLKPGSAALGHYQSVRDADEDNVTISSPIEVETNVRCESSYKYRSYNGSCNNLKNPKWGQTNSGMLRFLPPRYNGSATQVPKAVSGADLPLPRRLSTKIFPDVDRPSNEFSLAVMQWGQLVAHDFGLSPSAINAPANCCVSEASAVEQCYPIEIPSDDPFFSQFNQTCINMIRTQVKLKKYGCNYIPNQISAATHIMDFSEMYGSDIATAYSLRQNQSGLLRVSENTAGHDFPPMTDDAMTDCSAPSQDSVCFAAGDTRINQNIQLTSLQLIMLREHNRVARAFAALNPHWDDETLYQETRALVIAMFQHISYAHWLPIIIGQKAMKRYHLRPAKNGYTSYNDSLNPSTINSFMAGAFRIFHSSIQGKLSMVDARRCPFRSLNVSDYMNNPGLMMNNSNLDALLLGLTVESKQEEDRFFTTQMTQMMFHGNASYGEDLESFDIQRGRDHGIPSYNDMRQLCGKPKAYKFSDFSDVLTKKHIALLKSAYAHVDDVDYFVGGTLETRVRGALVGPSFLCIIQEQFVRKKFGDRFWYEVGGQVHSFTRELDAKCKL